MYRNYGDRNFFERGVLVDSDHSDTIFDILICRPYGDEDDLYQFGHCSVDITDEWIDRNAVASYLGMDIKNSDVLSLKLDGAIQFAIGCIDYYGPENFGIDDYSYSYDWRQADKALIKHELRNYMIAYDNLEVA